MGSGMTESDIPESKLRLDAWIRPESEEGKYKEGVRVLKTWDHVE